MSGQQSLSKSWTSTCGAFIGSGFSPTFSVTSSNVGLPSLIPRLRYSRTATGLSHGRVCERPELRLLVSALVDEGIAVAGALGVTLDADPEELIDHAAKREVAYDHKASMLQDVEARRQTEIDYLNGGIARFGREHGVPTPLNDTIRALVKGLEASWTS